MVRYWLFVLTLVVSLAQAEEFIGQWYIKHDNKTISAHTRDGDSQLQLIVANGKVIQVKLLLAKFSSFGEQDAVFQYSSPKYGLVRTTNYTIKNGQVIISNPFEVHSFVENLLDISTHLMFSQNNFGNSFKDRKITISYLDSAQQPKWRHAKFSTIEIDEVLASLGVKV